MSVVRDAHRIETSFRQAFPDRFVVLSFCAEEIAPDGDLVRQVRKMKVIVGHPETVVSAAESPVPVLLGSGSAAVEFHDGVAFQLFHRTLLSEPCPRRMIDLDKVTALGKHVDMELSLGGQDRHQVVPVPDFFGAEDQFVVLRKVPAMFIDIDIKGGTGRKVSETVVVGEGYEVVAESSERVGDLGGSVVAFVEYALDHRVRVEERPLPESFPILFQNIPVGIEYVGTAERLRHCEPVDRTDTCHADCRQKDKDDAGHRASEQRQKHFEHDGNSCAKLKLYYFVQISQQIN